MRDYEFPQIEEDPDISVWKIPSSKFIDVFRPEALDEFRFSRRELPCRSEAEINRIFFKRVEDFLNSPAIDCVCTYAGKQVCCISFTDAKYILRLLNRDQEDLKQKILIEYA